MTQQLGPKQRAWVEALKSGKYEQNRDGYLRTDDNRYCCLGVACEVLGTIEARFVAAEHDVVAHYEYDDHSGYMPPQLVSELGLYGPGGESNSFSSHSSLITLNDTYEQTFLEIAKILENNPSAYFMRDA